MQYVGLTGNIGSGKSTAATILEKLGAKTISADELAHKVVEPGMPAYQKIVEHFGREVLRSDQLLDRKRLARIVFQDRNQLEKLNSITHQEIHRLRNQKLVELHRNTPQSMVIYDVPLLFENKMQAQFQKVILICIDREIQTNRLMTLRHFSREELDKRLNHQIPQEEKIPLADFIVNNSDSPEHLKKRLDQIYKQIKYLPQLTLAEVI